MVVEATRSATKRFACLALVLALAGWVQGSGVKFENGLSWPEVLAKAKAENKCIFVDCYATWCGPCKDMNQKVFPDSDVGAFFEAHFVSVQVQMNETSKDSDAVKQWRPDAKQLAKEYGVSAYPTYLFFTPDGTAVHRVVGSAKDGKEFLAKVADVFEPGKQYYTAINAYKQHLGDPDYLEQALRKALAIHDDATAESIGNSYVAILKDPYATKDRLKLIEHSTRSTQDQGFRIFYDGRLKAEAVLGKSEVREFIRSIILTEKIFPLFAPDVPPVDWGATSNALLAEFPAEADYIILESKARYYLMKHELAEYEVAETHYMDRFANELQGYYINEAAWTAFQVSNNREFLLLAAEWSKRLIDGREVPNSNDLDTYANLLYKAGRHDDGIRWEAEALTIATEEKNAAHIDAFSKTIQKMKAGGKTWN